MTLHAPERRTVSPAPAPAPAPFRLLIVGAGAVGTLAGIALATRFAAAGPVEVLVLDQARLTAGHLAHPALYPEGAPGEPKADVLARRLAGAGAGITARALHGNLGRWPDAVFEGRLAIVGLDRESARLQAQRRLRAAGTPALVAGVAGTAWVQALGGGTGDACYLCGGQRDVPLDATPCIPAAARPSTRLLAAPAALAALPELAVALAGELLAGGGAGRTADAAGPGPAARARLARDPECVGPHGPDTAVIARIAANRGALVLDEAFAAAADFFGRPEETLLATAGAFRDDHACAACGASGLPGRALVRAWPARERCPRCGSEEVGPRVVLGAVTAEEAARRGWSSRTLADLGVPPLGHLDVVPATPADPDGVVPAVRIQHTAAGGPTP